MALPGRHRQLFPVDDRQSCMADSIMERVIFFAPMYAEAVESYRAELYIKGYVNIRKKNHIIRFIPTMFRLRKGVNEYMVESYSDLNYTAPNLYDQKVKASVGTVREFWSMDERLPEYFHINIYAPTLFNDQFVSPLAQDAPRYYVYRLDSVVQAGGERSFRIRFMPRFKSYQLVGGYLTVSENVWTVREIRFAGSSSLMNFNNHVWMGDVGKPDEFLPVRCHLEGRFRFLGNVVDGDYVASLQYADIVRQSYAYKVKKKAKDRYDLTDYYTLRCDTNAFRRDTAYFNSIRPFPLSAHERQLYDDYFLHADTLKKQQRYRNKHLVFWGQIGDWLTNRYTVDLAKMGSVRCSPLINPFLLSYSGSNGFSYRQEFKYNRLFSGDRLLRIVPQIGFNFTRKEFYWRIHSDFDYWPQKRASLHVDVGNGNRIYSSDVLDDLKTMPDSIFNFDQIHLDYFRDLYFKLTHTWEIVNGLTLDVGLTIHRRTETERSNFQLNIPVVTPSGNAASAAREDRQLSQTSLPYIDWDLINRLSHVYTSFAPRVRISYTPGQYYYMDGRRKVNLYSYYPTFSVEWERGIEGVLRHSGEYERLEVDMSQRLPIGPMRTLFLRAGWGKFTNQNNTYFVDFSNFSRHNLPVGWNDESGGVFQLLDGRWYNSASQYLRVHATYEAPFLLLRHLMKYTKYVLNERLYASALVIPHLKPYTELGYGIGTHIFDFGVFVSFANWKYQEIGCKFTFELFNR